MRAFSFPSGVDEVSVLLRFDGRVTEYLAQDLSRRRDGITFKGRNVR
jgi:hypothetical protein